MLGGDSTFDARLVLFFWLVPAQLARGTARWPLGLGPIHSSLLQDDPRGPAPEWRALPRRRGRPRKSIAAVEQVLRLRGEQRSTAPTAALESIPLYPVGLLVQSEAAVESTLAQ